MATYEKMLQRNEPVYPSDLKMLTEATFLLEMLNGPDVGGTELGVPAVSGICALFPASGQVQENREIGMEITRADSHNNKHGARLCRPVPAGRQPAEESL